MRGTAASLPVKNAYKSFHPRKGTWGMVTTSIPKEQGSKDGAEKANAAKEKSEPIVAFSKPPPLPPVLGPLVAFSLFETWYSCDGNDD